MRYLHRNVPREEELAALADGSLPEGRRAELEARVADSPELEAGLAEQRRAVQLVRSAAAGVEAPAGLRARVEAERRRARPTRLPRGRLVWAGGLVAATAVALAIVLTLPESVPGGPTVAEAAVLATRAATEPAPELQPGLPTLLAREVEGVPFPAWDQEFDWRPAGARTDTLEDRRATTVFYEKQGKRIGYSIFAGEALDVPEGADVVHRQGTELRVFRSGGREVVTWLRGGKTCILTGTGVDRDVLVKLAAWKGGDTIPF